MWIKICGIRDVGTARAVAALRPSAIGLNFFDRSPRRVSVETAREIVLSLPPDVEPIGLFVNHSVSEITEVATACRLKTVQLHGDEPPEFLAALSRTAELRILRAHRLGGEGLGPLNEYLTRCRDLGVPLAGLLIDARVAGEYGGTGRTAPWPLLNDLNARAEWPPLILAGGLHPQNVRGAIAAVQPWGVDVAGGVESAPGCKDPALVAAFIESARASQGERGASAP